MGTIIRQILLRLPGMLIVIKFEAKSYESGVSRQLHLLHISFLMASSKELEVTLFAEEVY